MGGHFFNIDFTGNNILLKFELKKKVKGKI